MTEETSNKILRYLRGEMDFNEQAYFEKRLEEDSALKKAYDVQAALLAGIEQDFIDEKKAMLSRHDKAKKNGNYEKYIKIGMLAASILIIISLGIYFMPFSSSNQNYQIIASNAFVPYPNYIFQNSRGADTNSNSQLKKGMRYYTIGNYQASAKMLENVTQKRDSGLYSLYLGNAYLASDKPEKAIKTFQKSADKLSKEFQPINQWYLALAYLYQKNTEKAKNLLQDLSQKQNIYRESAQSLLKKLNTLQK